MAKKKLTLSVDEEIINNAKKQKINLSFFLEIRLIDYFQAKMLPSGIFAKGVMLIHK